MYCYYSDEIPTYYDFNKSHDVVEYYVVEGYTPAYVTFKNKVKKNKTIKNLFKKLTPVKEIKREIDTKITSTFSNGSKLITKDNTTIWF